MFSDIYFNTCLRLWTFFAQASPAIPTAKAAPTASVHATSPAPAASVQAASPAASGTAAPLVPLSPAASGAPQIDFAPPVHHPVYVDIAHNLALLLYFVICVALVVCVMFQTTKSEGLSGVIGGTSTSQLFRGKKSAEETLSLWTTRLAVAFVICSLLIWLMFGRGGV